MNAGAYVAQPDNKELRPAESHDSLLRGLAHELRDALSPAAASVDLMKLSKFDPEVSATAAQRVERALQRAFSTIDAFTLAEQCERGALELDAATVGVNDVLQAASARLDADLRARSVFVSAATTVLINADLPRTAEVLDALVRHGQAWAAPGGAVTVRVLQVGSVPQISVSCRIDPQRAPGEDWFLSYRAGGRMALRTIRCIMDMQQGSLEVTIRAGAELEFLLKFAPGSQRAAAGAGSSEPLTPDANPRQGNLQLLIVDDSGEVRRAYREALQPLGYSVAEAADAEQALGILASSAPQVALIDIHLPRTNGYRLAQAIRARSGNEVRLIMLSGMTLDATTRRLSREAGFDDCLDKMAGPLALHRLLQQGPGS